MCDDYSKCLNCQQKAVLDGICEACGFAEGLSEMPNQYKCEACLVKCFVSIVMDNQIPLECPINSSMMPCWEKVG